MIELERRITELENRIGSTAFNNLITEAELARTGMNPFEAIYYYYEIYCN
jgi:hypothetical protein